MWGECAAIQSQRLTCFLEDRWCNSSVVIAESLLSCVCCHCIACSWFPSSDLLRRLDVLVSGSVPGRVLDTVDVRAPQGRAFDACSQGNRGFAAAFPNAWTAPQSSSPFLLRTPGLCIRSLYWLSLIVTAAEESDLSNTAGRATPVVRGGRYSCFRDPTVLPGT